MADINDAMTKAIQHYAQKNKDWAFRDVLMALAEDMATHVISYLGVQQEWGIATAFTIQDGREFLDDIASESDDRQYVADRLEGWKAQDEALATEHFKTNARRYLATRFFTEWEEESEPELGEALVEIVANEDLVLDLE